MKPFTRSETIGLSVIFLILIIMSVPNFALSIKRSRDNTRKGDLGSLVAALAAYQRDFSSFPLSTPDGKIIACKRPEDKVEVDEKGNLIINLIPCEWGSSGIFDFTDESADPYVSPLPNDPQSRLGLTYFYISNGRRYQVYAHLESTDDDQYDEKIAARNLPCGNGVCNTGRAHSHTPLDKSIEEYENELYEQSLKEQGLYEEYIKNKK